MGNGQCTTRFPPRPRDPGHEDGTGRARTDALQLSSSRLQACTHYVSMIENTAFGHRFLKVLLRAAPAPPRDRGAARPTVRNANTDDSINLEISARGRRSSTTCRASGGRSTRSGIRRRRF